MKPPCHPRTRITVRLKPGRILRLPPRLLKCAGWRIGDALLVRVEDGDLVWSRLPDEQTSRINRLRRRIGVAKGKFKVPDTIDANNARVGRLFVGGDQP